MPDDRKTEDDGHHSNKPFDRKEHQFTKKSKMILGQVQQRQKQEEEEQVSRCLIPSRTVLSDGISASSND